MEPLKHNPGEWLKGQGPESDIVISSRVRLARNIRGYPFSSRATPEQKAELQELLCGVIKRSRTVTPHRYMDIEESSEIDRTFLVERHLISRDLVRGEGARGVAINGSEVVSVMVNEEDHLRIQVLKSGFQLRKTWERANKIDNALSKELKIAFSRKLGYLTACPTNVGTGLRVSALMHLPALVITKDIEKVFYSVVKINLAVRGLYGEGTQASSDFFQISNQVTLGKSEEEILRTVESVIPSIIEYERKAREALMADNRTKLEDQVWRALGTLRSARTITSEETMEKLSALRMGVNLGVVQGVNMQTVNELFILTLPAHLQKMRGEELNPEERDILRAEYIRERLN